MLVDIVNGQVKDNAVSIIVLNNQINEELCASIDRNVLFVRIGRPKGSKNPWYFIKMNYVINSFKPDIVHIHMTGLYRFYKLTYPIVFTAHSNMIKKEDVLHYPIIYCISKAVENTCKQLGANETRVIYNGIHTDNIIPKISHSFNKNIVCVGRLARVKGQQVLIDAMNVIVNKEARLTINLSIIGSGDTESELKEMVKSYNLQGNVHFLGSKSREFIFQHLKDYDLLVMPSINEGFGLTLAEAMAAKIPVLCSDLDGPMEIIDHGRLGDYFKSGNAESLASKIVFCLDNLDFQRLENARKYVVDRFDINQTINNYKREYERIILKES